MKILVTDDSKMARKMVIKILKDILGENVEIHEGQNGQEALDLYKELLPKIVFLDLTMPIMDGFEALEKIKEFDTWTCPTCGHKNNNSLFACGSCKLARPSSTL